MRGLTKAEFTNKYLGPNIREHSNGETAIKYFYDNLIENGLYLLDEPENSLSPKHQQELAYALYELVNHLGCQMIISTHSPFMLAIEGALIYDLDNNAQPKKWTELSGVRSYYNFFMEHAEDTSVYFQDKLIWQCGDEYTELQGKYPVIFLTFKDVKCSSWDETLNKISKLISLEFLRHIELENGPILNAYEKEQFSLFANNKANEIDYQMSLQLLSMLLHKHYKKEAIIIIDEYVPPFSKVTAAVSIQKL